MARYLTNVAGGKTVHVKSGATWTFDSGSTLVVSGTFTVSATNLTASGNFATTGTLTAGSSLAVTTTSVLSGNVTIGDGYAGTGSLLTAAGAASFKGALIVDGASTLTGTVTIGAGAATITDTVATLTITEDNISLVGATVVTGALTCSGAFAAGTTNHFNVDANGLLKLNNAITIDGHTTVDVLMLGAIMGVCNDASPSAVPTGGCVLYFDGTNLKAMLNGGTSATLNNAAFA